MQVVWKYKLQVSHEQFIAIPEGAVILSVQTLFGEPCLWALVDPEAPEVSRKLITYGTGDSIKEEIGAFIGTYQLNNGFLVFHVFEEFNNDTKN